MAKFLRKAMKEVGQAVDVASIPAIKNERNALERERDALVAEVQTARADAEVMRAASNALEVVIAAQQQAVVELRIAFERVRHTPGDGSAERPPEPLMGDAPPLTAAQKRAKQFDDLFFTLTRTQQQLVEHNAALSAQDTLEKEIRIEELTSKIDKMNDRLNKIRGGG